MNSIVLMLLGLATALSATPVSTDPYANETPAERDARMEWWREAKFGMFIHWGVYAVPAGAYAGKQIEDTCAWIMLEQKIPVAEYRAYAKEFNPVKYRPVEWVKLARDAGMRYMILTSKHHDGFALYPSEFSDWDIADATPYGKDLIGPLAEAARAGGLKFGLYYSQAQDWINPGGAKRGFKEGDGWDTAHKGSFDDYLKTIAIPQTREILTRYQPDVLWWDTPSWMTPERAGPLAGLLKLRPGIITNNRLLKKGADIHQGDTDTPEQHIPATGFGGRDWETCMTINDIWGFNQFNHNWKSTETLLRNLIDIVSKGGNYLLNVGPTKDGEIPQPGIKRLEEIGAWMKTNGEAIYGTGPTAFGYELGQPTGKDHRGRPTMEGALDWRCTTKPGKYFIHLFEWPGARFELTGMKPKASKVYLLADPQRKPLVFTEDNGMLTVNLPETAPGKHINVLCLETQPN